VWSLYAGCVATSSIRSVHRACAGSEKYTLAYISAVGYGKWAHAELASTA
jgi:hypothetical protein